MPDCANPSRRQLSWPDCSTICGLCIAALAAGPAFGEASSSLNFRGVPGLVDMPSALSMADADFALTVAGFGPISRVTIAFQVSPGIEAAFRYNNVSQWNDASNSYYDANVDLRFRLLEANGWQPSIVVGLQDLVGNGLNSAEYIVATENLGKSVTVTAGLGWGRFGSYDPLFSTGVRPPVNLEQSGLFDWSQYFSGDVAAFGGVQWRVNPKWTLLAEYSSDNYTIEADEQGAFDRTSPLNFGVEYRANPALTLGAYYMYGNQIGLSASMVLNARKRIGGPIMTSAPETLAPRPDRATHPDEWTSDWVTTPDAAAQIAAALGSHLERPGIVIESVSIAADTVQVRYRNTKIDAEPQAIGRVARAMSQVLPPSVEVFRIVPMINGMPGIEVTIRRSDLEALDFVPDSATALREVAVFGPAHPPTALLAYNPDLYPKLVWSISPFVDIRLFDEILAPSASIALRAAASYTVAPGLILAGSVTGNLLGSLNASDPEPSPLPPVRRETGLYDTLGSPTVERLTAAWYSSLGPDVYSRVTTGYLERMFGGISGEVLWRPTGKRWALGIEANYVAQRDPDDAFGFGYFDYQVATGHVSGYFDFGGGYYAQLDVGRYLAADVGGTLTLTREFANGWKLGAFATLTNVSPQDFGDGSFDKGVILEIPMAWLLGNSTRNKRGIVLRPYDRDGGAKLDVDGRLYEVLHSYDQSRIDAQWQRFWR